MVITWAIDLSQSPQSTQRKINNLYDLCGLCEITRKLLQLSKFLMAEIKTDPRFSKYVQFILRSYNPNKGT